MAITSLALRKRDDVVDAETEPDRRFELRIDFGQRGSDRYRAVTISHDCTVEGYSRLTIEEQCFAAEVAKLCQRFLKRK